nr:hypothetical protein BaRGS_012628 [Batillaria attramentaria]
MTWLTLTSMTSLREALFVLVVVALASMTITFHLGHYLNPLQQTPNDSDDAISGGSNHLKRAQVPSSVAASACLSSQPHVQAKGQKLPD